VSGYRARFWIEAGLAAVAGMLAVVTLVWRDWIEALTGLDPDRHDGSLEWLIVAVLTVSAVVLAQLARRERRLAAAH
jgi:hypothetical protein